MLKCSISFDMLLWQQKENIFHTLNSHTSFGLLTGSLKPLLKCSCRFVPSLAAFFILLMHVRLFSLCGCAALQPAHHHLAASCGFGSLESTVDRNMLLCFLTANIQYASIFGKKRDESDTFVLFRSIGCRHSGELLRELLTSEETGWKVKVFLDCRSFMASTDFTSPKSSHFLISSSPSRIAGILKSNHREVSRIILHTRTSKHLNKFLFCLFYLWWMLCMLFEASTVIILYV